MPRQSLIEDVVQHRTVTSLVSHSPPRPIAYASLPANKGRDRSSSVGIIIRHPSRIEFSGSVATASVDHVGGAESIPVITDEPASVDTALGRS
jgi:hypothetical protein